ncbi:MAG: RagB/SusD family nutrient uptake outer membrane protein [Tannerellaceae bacterium]|nr:RagB/SusD family nutrient uptake outer membrane protein [Tannerellaceae bacterium]
MKKYIVICLIGAVGLSCDQDVLDIPQKGVLELENFYQNATDDDAESLIAAVHKNFYMDAMGVTNLMALNLMGDDTYCGGNSFADQATGYRLFSYYNFTFSQASIQSLYTAFFKINYWCNLIVEKLQADTPVKKRVVAEAKFYRGLCYLYLIRLWGTPPLVPDSETGTTPPNGNPLELWDWVEQNFSEAATDLPSKPAKGAQRTIGGRPAKEAALAYLGKTLVIRKKYAEAALALKAVIDSDKYALLEDMSVLYHHEADFCDEYVMEFNLENDASTGVNQSDSRHIWMNWRYTNLATPLGCFSAGWGFGQSPTREFIEFAQQHELLDDKSYSSRYHDFFKSYDDILAMEYPEGITPGIIASVGFIVDNVGYFGTRWMLRSSDVIAGTGVATAMSVRSHANQPYMRYAEVLLLYAEAEAGMNRNDGEGLAALNNVRTRAGLPPLSSMKLQDIKDERRIEFWGDGERFFDLVRWGDALTVLADVNKYRYQLNGKNPDGSYHVSSDGKTYGYGFTAGKNEVWPFPETELIANPDLIQNPGW